MSEEKQTENDPERTLLTLDQLSQTIEVMTSVVNRLRQHLSEQLQAQAQARAAQQSRDQQQAEAGNEPEESKKLKAKPDKASSEGNEREESFVVEIKQQEADPVRKNSKTLH